MHCGRVATFFPVLFNLSSGLWVKSPASKELVGEWARSFLNVEEGQSTEAYKEEQMSILIENVTVDENCEPMTSIGEACSNDLLWDFRLCADNPLNDCGITTQALVTVYGGTACVVGPTGSRYDGTPSLVRAIPGATPERLERFAIRDMYAYTNCMPNCTHLFMAPITDKDLCTPIAAKTSSDTFDSDLCAVHFLGPINFPSPTEFAFFSEGTCALPESEDIPSVQWNYRARYEFYTPPHPPQLNVLGYNLDGKACENITAETQQRCRHTSTFDYDTCIRDPPLFCHVIARFVVTYFGGLALPSRTIPRLVRSAYQNTFQISNIHSEPIFGNSTSSEDTDKHIAYMVIPHLNPLCIGDFYLSNTIDGLLRIKSDYMTDTLIRFPGKDIRTDNSAWTIRAADQNCTLEESISNHRWTAKLYYHFGHVSTTTTPTPPVTSPLFHDAPEVTSLNSYFVSGCADPQLEVCTSTERWSYSACVRDAPRTCTVKYAITVTFWGAAAAAGANESSYVWFNPLPDISADTRVKVTGVASWRGITAPLHMHTLKAENVAGTRSISTKSTEVDNVNVMWTISSEENWIATGSRLFMSTDRTFPTPTEVPFPHTLDEVLGSDAVHSSQWTYKVDMFFERGIVNCCSLCGSFWSRLRNR